MLDKRRRKKWKIFRGVTENSRTRTVKYSSCFTLVNLLDTRNHKTDEKH